MKKMIFAALVAMLVAPAFMSCAKEEPANPIAAAASAAVEGAAAVKEAASAIAK